MKVAVLGTSLGSGGAERQMCILAVELTRRGHNVTVITYAEGDFYSSLLKGNNIRHVFLDAKGKWGRFLKIRSFFKIDKPDVVLSFSSGPSSYAECSSWPRKGWGLVVSERTANLNVHKNIFKIRKYLHLTCDYIITNSYANRIMLEQLAPFLKKRITTIYNAVNFDLFNPGEKGISGKYNINFLTVARFNKNKNINGLIKAVDILVKKYACRHLFFDWYGNIEDDNLVYSEAQKTINSSGLEKYITLHPPFKDVTQLYRKSDVLILPSFLEGLPNVVCEAMSCGKPILMSNVCDAANLVREGENGFLFDPASAESIASAIYKFSELDNETKRHFGEASYSLAKKLFDPLIITGKYEEILLAAADHRRIKLTDWPEEARDIKEGDTYKTCLH